MEPSEEQASVIDYRLANPDEDLGVRAAAGSGKTALLVMLAKRKKRRSLYVCFNTEIAEEATRRLPYYVTPLTSHKTALLGLARQDILGRLRKRLLPSQLASLYEIAPAGSTSAPKLAQWGMDTVQAFANSADPVIAIDHLPRMPADDRTEQVVLGIAKRLWADMVDPNSTVPMTHDGYLRIWQIQGAPLPEGIEDILYDEAQDANPATLAALQTQGLPMTYVGDPYQNINRFRGSTNAFLTLNDIRLFSLSQSYRFGQAVADAANAVLAQHSLILDSPLRGRPDIESRLGPFDRSAEGGHAVICRTNAGILEHALEGRDKIMIVGGGEALAALMRGAWSLYCGEKTETEGLERFASWSDVEEAAEEENGAKQLVRLVQEYGSGLPAKADELGNRLVDQEELANRVLSTAHRFKGRQKQRVRLANDFPLLSKLEAQVDRGKASLADIDEALHLLYVALTRAQVDLEPNDALAECLERAAFRSTAKAGAEPAGEQKPRLGRRPGSPRSVEAAGRASI